MLSIKVKTGDRILIEYDGQQCWLEVADDGEGHHRNKLLFDAPREFRIVRKAALDKAAAKDAAAALEATA
jgi:hypothetical protein